MFKKEDKSKIIETFAKSKNDTGSCGVQIALLSDRIKQISAHLEMFPKDKHSRQGLLQIVGKRRSFLNNLKRSNSVEHAELVKLLRKNSLIK